jgi:micrococcal nuclease
MRILPRLIGFASFALVSLSLAGPALADPCKAIPDRGPAPAWLASGSSFSGPVVYVGDGDSLCVAVGQGSANWVEVRLADFYAPELSAPGGAQAKAALARIAAGRQAICLADHQTYDRIAAVCSIAGRNLGDLLRAAGVREGGRGR